MITNDANVVVDDDDYVYDSNEENHDDSSDYGERRCKILDELLQADNDGDFNDDENGADEGDDNELMDGNYGNNAEAAKASDAVGNIDVD